jgi:hypothetical protein
MSLQRWMRRSAPLAAAAVVGAAPLAFAQSPLVIGQPRVQQIPAQSQAGAPELFEWTGQVDREVQVVMRGGNVWTNNIGQTEQPRAQARAYTRLPNQDGQVAVQMMNGRGRVDVIQQPSRQNDYTTIVRIRDDQSGSGMYRLAAYWQGYGTTSNGEVYGSNGRDRDIYRPRDDNNDGRDIYRPNDNNGRGRGRDGNYGRGANAEALHWVGNVDGDLEIRIQNGRVAYRNMSGSNPTNVRSNVGNARSMENGNLGVQVNQGRGNVDIVQQPQQWNGYTTIIRVRDPQRGSSYYDFSIVRR